LKDDISVEALIAELQAKFDTYFVLPNLTSYYNDPTVHNRWLDLLGQNFLRLEDPEGISELIASTIGLAEEAVDLDGVARDLKEAGRESVSGAVSQALTPLAELGPRSIAIAPASFGAGTGLARL
jgi:hypothetical protein